MVSWTVETTRPTDERSLQKYGPARGRELAPPPSFLGSMTGALSRAPIPRHGAPIYWCTDPLPASASRAAAEAVGRGGERPHRHVRDAGVHGHDPHRSRASALARASIVQLVRRGCLGGDWTVSYVPVTVLGIPRNRAASMPYCFILRCRVL